MTRRLRHKARRRGAKAQWLRRLLNRRETLRDPRAAAEARQSAERSLEQCLDECVLPALRKARDHLNEQGYAAALDQGSDGIRLTVVRDHARHCVYHVEGRLYHKPSFAFPSLHGAPSRPQFPCLRIDCEGHTREWEKRHVSAEAIYEDAMNECHKWLDW